MSTNRALSDVAIKKLQLTCMNDDDIQDYSPVLITNLSTVDAITKEPVKNGLYDLRMGPYSNAHSCTYSGCCGIFKNEIISMHVHHNNEETHECPGHFGHIKLARPIINPILKSVMSRALRCFCRHCGALLLWGTKRKNVMEYIRLNFAPNNKIDEAFQYLANIIGTKERCQPSHLIRTRLLNGELDTTTQFYCGKYHGKVKDSIPKHSATVENWYQHQRMIELPNGNIVSHPITGVVARSDLRYAKIQSLSQEGGMFNGCDEKARHFLSCFTLQYLPVIPPCARPLRLFDSDKLGQNEFTFKYENIFKTSEKYQDFLKGNHLREDCILPNRQAHERRALEYDAAIQYAVEELFDNHSSRTKPPSDHYSGRTTVKTSGASFATHQHGKGGLIRKHLSGKRVDFSARSVITPDPNLRLDEIGLPKEWECLLTVVERVTTLNREKLQSILEEDQLSPHFYKHGVRKSIFLDDGYTMRDLVAKPYSLQLDGPLPIGAIVERNLRNGDWVVFNRQPTLHRPSLMAARTRLLPGQTIRLNLAHTTPLNADFDGDEINIHIAQTLEATVEKAELMATVKQLITPKRGSACMGLVQDEQLGIWLLSRRDTFLTREQFMQLMFAADIQDIDKIPPPAICTSTHQYWTGKQVISMTIPSYISCIRSQENGGAGDGESADNEIVIIGGKLLCGMLNKQIVGVSGGSIQQMIYNYFANDHVERDRQIIEIFEQLKQLAHAYLCMTGFSVGLGDMCVNTETMMEIQKMTDSVHVQVKNEIEQAFSGDSTITDSGINRGFDNIKGIEEHSLVKLDTLINTLERRIVSIQDKQRDKAGDFAVAQLRKVNVNNNLLAMVNAGSKGKRLNLAQITACVGGQMISNRRICDQDLHTLNWRRPLRDMVTIGDVFYDEMYRYYTRRLFFNRRRMLPHLVEAFPGALDGGFIAQGYIKGHPVLEFFWHAMASRKGLTDTAVSTAETGYVQRRMIKCMEDLSIAYDGSVVNCEGRVVQTTAAMSPDKCELTLLPAASRWSEKSVRKHLFWDPKLINGEFRDVIIQEHTSITESIRVCRRAMEEANDTHVRIGTVNNTRRLLTFVLSETPSCVSARIALKHGGVACGHLPSLDILSKFTYTEADMEVIDRILSNTGQILIRGVVDCIEIVNVFFDKLRDARILLTALDKAELHILLATKSLMMRYCLSRGALEALLSRLYLIFIDAQPQPGESIGILTAQTIGEERTQQTLNTFHNAGTSIAVVGGAERLVELIGKKSGTTMMTPLIKCCIAGDFALKQDAMTKAYELYPYIRTILIGDLLQSTSIKYEPFDYGGECGKISYHNSLPSHVDEDDDLKSARILLELQQAFGLSETQSAILDALDKLQMSNVKTSRIRQHPQTSDDDSKVSQHNDPFVPRCIGSECRYDKESGCVGSFVLTLKMNSEALDRFHIDLGNLEYALATQILQGKVICEIIPPSNGIFYIRLRLRKCLVFNVAVHQSDTTTEELEYLDMTQQELFDLRIAGAPGVRTINVSTQSMVIPSTCETKEYYFMEAVHHDLQYFLGLDQVDSSKTTCNSIMDVERALGAVAARNALVRELELACELAGSKVNYQHATLMADAMFLNGTYEAFTWNSMTSMHGDFLIHASFEHNTESFINAAINSATIPIVSPSACVINGQKSRMGTGAIDLFIDVTQVKDAIEIANPEKTIIQTRQIDIVPPTPSVANFGSALHPNDTSYIHPNQQELAGTFSPISEYGDIFQASSALDEEDFAILNRLEDSPSYAFPHIQSPTYSPTSPAYLRNSPTYSPTSPAYSPTSPTYSPTSPTYSPASPEYSPTSPQYSPTSPSYSPTSPTYSPTSPQYSPSSPTYSPSSPTYSPSSPSYSPSSPTFSPTSPSYSPSSPCYTPPLSPLSPANFVYESSDDEVELYDYAPVPG